MEKILEFENHINNVSTFLSFTRFLIHSDLKDAIKFEHFAKTHANGNSDVKMHSDMIDETCKEAHKGIEAVRNKNDSMSDNIFSMTHVSALRNYLKNIEKCSPSRK